MSASNEMPRGTLSPRAAAPGPVPAGSDAEGPGAPFIGIPVRACAICGDDFIPANWKAAACLSCGEV